MNRCLVFLIFIDVFYLHSSRGISDEEYKLLPPVFYIDDFTTCTEEHKTYCRITINLLPVDPEEPSTVSKLIQDCSQSGHYYNHAELHHAICVNDFCKNFDENSQNLSQFIGQCYTNKYANLSLKADVTEIKCDNDVYTIKSADIVVLLIISSYFALVAYATKKDISKRKTNKYLIVFSLRHNYLKLVSAYRNDDHRAMRSMEGIRFCITCLVIGAHTFMGFTAGYVANTKFVEEIPENTFKRGISNLISLALLPFFVISAWVLSYHTLKQQEKIRKEKLPKVVLLSLLNRYFRLVPALLPPVAIGATVWLQLMHGKAPLQDLFFGKEYQRCRKNWWMTILFFNNHYGAEICYPNTWYLSADTKLFLISLTAIVLTLKFSLRTKAIVLAIFAIMGMIISATMSYVYNLDYIHRYLPETYTYFEFVDSLEFYHAHMSTHSNTSTYMLGILFGYFHFKYEKENVFKNKVRVMLWWLATFGLPFSIMYVATFYQPGRVGKALLAALAKPTFSLGVAIGLFGILQGVGGFVKKFLEWKPIIFMAKFSYCTYLVHMVITMYRSSAVTEPMVVSDLAMIAALIPNLILSFAAGALLHILVEMPAAQLQQFIQRKYELSSKQD